MEHVFLARRREAAEGIAAPRRETQLACAPQPPPVKPKVDREKTEQEKQKTRDWILQYAQEDSDSEEGSNKVHSEVLYGFLHTFLIMLRRFCRLHRWSLSQEIIRALKKAEVH